MLQLTLLSYEGPGSIAGVPFDAMTVAEHAEGSGEAVVRRWWEVTATALRADVPEEMVVRAAEGGGCRVVVPGVGEAVAEVMNVALVDGQRWELELRGEGRAPLT